MTTESSKKDAETPNALVQEGLTLQEAGIMADHLLAQSTFARYRERKAPHTIRRHRADIDLFTTYLLQLPGVQTVGDLYHDPCAWASMTKGLVEGFVRWQVQQGYAIGSINMRLSTVKLYCKLAQGAGALHEEHAAMIRTGMGYRGREGRRIDALRPITRVGDKKAEPTPLTVTQAQALIQQSDTPDVPAARRAREDSGVNPWLNIRFPESRPVHERLPCEPQRDLPDVPLRTMLQIVDHIRC